MTLELQISICPFPWNQNPSASLISPIIHSRISIRNTLKEENLVHNILKIIEELQNLSFQFEKIL